MGGPIKPKDITKAKLQTIPEEVFEAFNELIVKNFSDGESTVKQGEIINLMIEKLMRIDSNDLPDHAKHLKNQIFDNHWLDIEDDYRKVGWVVSYDRPGYCESYEPSWTFTKKKTR